MIRLAVLFLFFQGAAYASGFSPMIIPFKKVSMKAEMPDPYKKTEFNLLLKDDGFGSYSIENIEIKCDGGEIEIPPKVCAGIIRPDFRAMCIQTYKEFPGIFYFVIKYNPGDPFSNERYLYDTLEIEVKNVKILKIEKYSHAKEGKNKFDLFEYNMTDDEWKLIEFSKTKSSYNKNIESGSSPPQPPLVPVPSSNTM